jgi:hypothetical protein
MSPHQNTFGPTKKNQNGNNTIENSGMSEAAKVMKGHKRRGEVK